jgi:hypothetical protein
VVAPPRRVWDLVDIAEPLGTGTTKTNLLLLPNRDLWKKHDGSKLNLLILISIFESSSAVLSAVKTRLFVTEMRRNTKNDKKSVIFWIMTNDVWNL